MAYLVPLHPKESLFGQLGESHYYPERSQRCERLRQWRFYYEFAVWPGSPVLAHDGSNLATT